MKYLSITKSHVHYFLGLVAGCVGIGLFVSTSYVNPIRRTGTSSVKAATTTYKTQWLMTQVRTFDIFRPAIPAAGFSSARPERVWGQIDVGPAEWQVRSCIGADFATQGDHASLGNCPAGSANVFETWSVPAGSWAVPLNLGDVGGGDIPLRARGLNRARAAIPASNNVRVNDSGGEGRGWAFRSGLYGVMFATDDDSVSANGKGKWWAYSEMPLKWQVSGTITTP